MIFSSTFNIRLTGVPVYFAFVEACRKVINGTRFQESSYHLLNMYMVYTKASVCFQFEQNGVNEPPNFVQLENTVAMYIVVITYVYSTTY
jgi:hypothetical protein